MEPNGGTGNLACPMAAAVGSLDLVTVYELMERNVRQLREAGFTRRPSWRSLPSDGMDDEPTEAQIENKVLRDALEHAEDALADIGDEDQGPIGNILWCKRRAAGVLPLVRAALAAKEPK